ncbi:MAG: DUF721 domain-containing protein [bacterium]
MNYTSWPVRRHKKSVKAPQSVGGVIEKVVKSLGISGSYHGWLIVSKWPEIVGERVAARSRALRYSEGTLYVAVPDDTWRQELSMEREAILRKIHSYPSGRVVKELRFVQGEKGL